MQFYALPLLMIPDQQVKDQASMLLVVLLLVLVVPVQLVLGKLNKQVGLLQWLVVGLRLELEPRGYLLSLLLLLRI